MPVDFRYKILDLAVPVQDRAELAAPVWLDVPLLAMSWTLASSSASLS
ncbi:hypothetical protein ACSBOB_17530 [Mesorhizobium sp. ASY16-5R]